MLTPPSLLRDGATVRLRGEWTLAAMLPGLPALQQQLAAFAGGAENWDLVDVERIDSAAAVLLWRVWGEAWPSGLLVSPLQRQVLARAAALPHDLPPVEPELPHPVAVLGGQLLKAAENFRGLVTLFGRLLLDLAHLLRHPADAPAKEFAANVYKSGVLALPVTALVGFLIGVAISYLSALQLKNLGADLFIVNILGIGIIRELGPVLVAVLVAGRSGSAMTAQIGVMRVTEEIDALATMGIPRSVRVVLPKIAALTVVMPLLVFWTSAVALFGGMLAAWLQLDLSLAYFIDNLPRAVPVANLWIGLAKGVCFGFIIALVACHFGLRVKPNSESLASSTTRAVVTAITAVILIDALFAIFTRQVGIPRL